MTRTEIERLREDVGCAAVLEQAGFAIDEKESTRRSVKFRRGGEIIIVTHEDRGWFDPLSDSKGDVFSLAGHLHGSGFLASYERVAALVGFIPSRPVRPLSSKAKLNDPAPSERWHSRKIPRPGSKTWQYLHHKRSLPAAIIHVAASQGLLREGPCASMWAAHTDASGAIMGWEERGPNWRGFASGGTKLLFRLGSPSANRVCVTEAAIDAMSLAALEGARDSSLYVSTGGGWSPQAVEALRDLVSRPDSQLLAATDANPQGDIYAERLRILSDDVGCAWLRLRPPAGDWNDALKARSEKKREMKLGSTAAPDAAASREASPGQCPALDPAARIAGGPACVTKD